MRSFYDYDYQLNTDFFFARSMCLVTINIITQGHLPALETTETLLNESVRAVVYHFMIDVLIIAHLCKG